MYLLIEGSKGSYERPIIISIVGEYHTLEEASEELKSICYDYEDEDLIDEAIKNHKEFYESHWGGYYKYLGYTENYLTYYSTGCPADNEYDGRSYEIFKVGE